MKKKLTAWKARYEGMTGSLKVSVQMKLAKRWTCFAKQQPGRAMQKFLANWGSPFSPSLCTIWRSLQENISRFGDNMYVSINCQNILRRGIMQPKKTICRAPLKGGPVLLSTTQAGPGRNFTQPRACLLVELDKLSKYPSSWYKGSRRFRVDRVTNCHAIPWTN